MTLVNSLLASGTSEPQRLGVDVQALDRALAGAAGVDAGVMVTWVDPNGPAAGQLAPFDVIEMIGGERMWTPAHWRARVMRVTPGETLQLQVRRRGEVRRIDIVAQPVSGGADTGLGVTLQADRQGTLLVVRVDRRSAAARAGLRPGDVITSLDGVTRLTPAAVDRAFDALPVDRPLLLAVERGDEHRVVAVTRR
jgi:serine protease Do